MGELPIDVMWLMANAPALALVTARTAGVCFTAPVLAAPGLGWRFRVVMALALGGWTAPLALGSIGAPASGIGLGWMAANEAIVGGLMGLSASLVVAGARQAGELVSSQAGLATSALFDPETGEESTPLGHLYGLIALAAFLAMDGPLMILDSLLRSFETVPVGGLAMGRESAQALFSQTAEALKLALRAAAPPGVALAAAGVALGWLGRLAPSVPLMALSLPIRATLGVVLVMASLAGLVACLDDAWLAWADG
ncbi:flagellar biosynthetic protein FliR [Paludisphaera sp.]|uniref:flagellar biosynthetic protein FliR n=1 Tax=Paludisphaera sp. TaxID=2017432 RepID=UPI00301DE6CB